MFLVQFFVQDPEDLERSPGRHSHGRIAELFGNNFNNQKDQEAPNTLPPTYGFHAECELDVQHTKIRQETPERKQILAP